jgi:hypothetical protein
MSVVILQRFSDLICAQVRELAQQTDDVTRVVAKIGYDVMHSDPSAGDARFATASISILYYHESFLTFSVFSTGDPRKHDEFT